MGPSFAYSSWILLSDIISLLVLRFLLSEHVSLKLNTATTSITWGQDSTNTDIGINMSHNDKMQTRASKMHTALITHLDMPTSRTNNGTEGYRLCSRHHNPHVHSLAA